MQSITESKTRRERHRSAVCALLKLSQHTIAEPGSPDPVTEDTPDLCCFWLSKRIVPIARSRQFILIIIIFPLPSSHLLPPSPSPDLLLWFLPPLRRSSLHVYVVPVCSELSFRAYSICLTGSLCLTCTLCCCNLSAYVFLSEADDILLFVKSLNLLTCPIREHLNHNDGLPAIVNRTDILSENLIRCGMTIRCISVTSNITSLRPFSIVELPCGVVILLMDTTVP